MIRTMNFLRNTFKLVELFDDINIWSNKAIVWTGFVDNVEWLCGKLEEFVPQKVHGYMSVADRNESIRRFKSDEDCRLLLATPGAAKEGLTLTVANHAIFYDRSFSLDDYISGTRPNPQDFSDRRMFRTQRAR